MRIPTVRGRRIAFLVIAATCLASGITGCAKSSSGSGSATTKPDSPITMIIPFGVGGGVDIAGREVASALKSGGGVNATFQIKNENGGAGEIGIQDLISHYSGKSNALCITGTHIVGTPLLQGSDFSYKSVTPLARLFTEYEYLLVRPDSKFKTVQDVATALKANPKSVRIGGASAGAGDNLTAALFAEAAGIDPSQMVYVPFDGNDAITALLGNHVDVAFAGPDELDLVRGHKLNAIAMSAPQPVAGSDPMVPTFAQAGFPSVVFSNWRLLFGPPKMSAGAIAYWQKALNTMNASSVWTSWLQKNGENPDFATTGLDTFLAGQTSTYTALMQKLGILK
jgi:putative tricarboxylic transport membrane protein